MSYVVGRGERAYGNSLRITARLAERRRRPDSSWRYVVTLALWSEVDDQWGRRPEPYDTVMTAPAKSCTLIRRRGLLGTNHVRATPQSPQQR